MWELEQAVCLVEAELFAPEPSVFKYNAGQICHEGDKKEFHEKMERERLQESKRERERQRLIAQMCAGLFSLRYGCIIMHVSRTLLHIESEFPV